MDEAALPFFSSDEFFAALAEAYFPGRSHAGCYVTVGGMTFRALVVGGRTIAPATWPITVLHEPVTPPPGVEPLRVPYLQWASSGVVTVDEAREWSHGFPLPALFIDWTGFCSWQQYRDEVVRIRPGGRHESLSRDRKRLVRALGPVETSFDDPDLEAWTRAIAWKSAQFRRTRTHDWFADPRTALFFEGLRRRNLLTVATLRAGGRLAAVWAGTEWHGQFLALLTAYDPALATYSPGVILLRDLLEDRFARGDREFNFLRGRESYKWLYATHARLVGPVGVEPLRRRIPRSVRARGGSALQRWPAMSRRIRAAEQRLLGWRDRG